VKYTVKRALIVGCILLFVIILLRYFGVGNYLTFEQLKSNSTYLKQLVGYNYWFSVAIYLGVYLAVIACCIPATPPLTIVGGFLFGVVPGIVYSLIGATVGATISFLLVRYVLKNTVSIYFHDKIEQFNKQVTVYGMASYLLILQFVTIFPFFVVNTLAGLANVPLWTFVWTSLVGSFPSLLVYTLAGRQLGTIESARDLFSPSLLIVFVILILIVLFPLFLRKFR